MFKTVNNLVPEYLSDKFASINTIHRHNLRGAQHNLFIPRPNTEALKKRFRYRGAVTWNSLSAEAKQATTLNCFYSAIHPVLETRSKPTYCYTDYDKFYLLMLVFLLILR